MESRRQGDHTYRHTEVRLSCVDSGAGARHLAYIHVLPDVKKESIR